METDKYIRYNRVKKNISEKDIDTITFEINKILNDFMKNADISKINRISYTSLAEENINYNNTKCDVYKFSTKTNDSKKTDTQVESLFKTLIAKTNINKNLICNYIYISLIPMDNEKRLYVALHIKDTHLYDMDVEYNINKVYKIKN